MSLSTSLDLFDLTGKVAIVTGSSRGIGRAIAFRMAQRGARVVISSRKVPACDSVAAEINAAFSGSAVAVPADIADKAQLERLVARTMDTFGGIDLLVCNAAISPHQGSLGSIDDAMFRNILDTNVLSGSWLATMVAPHMRVRGGGAISFISSMGALRGTSVFGAYSVSKAALIQLARSFAVEFAPDGIRVNCIAPGLIRTDFARQVWQDAEFLKRVVQGTPLGRMGEADDVAGAAVFLASAAGGYVTGQTIVVDGGITTTLPGI
jgi:NAD(P)-dependent dehydrogenase (short-subunit alcohol dehydrogenase family)